MVAELFAVTFRFDGGDAGIFHGDKGEVGGGRRGKMQRRPHPQVVGHALQPLKKIQPQQPDTANEREDENRQNDRRAFEWFELHRAQLNKKPEQLKAALVFNIDLKTSTDRRDCERPAGSYGPELCPSVGEMWHWVRSKVKLTIPKYIVRSAEKDLIQLGDQAGRQRSWSGRFGD